MNIESENPSFEKSIFKNLIGVQRKFKRQLGVVFHGFEDLFRDEKVSRKIYLNLHNVYFLSCKIEQQLEEANQISNEFQKINNQKLEDEKNSKNKIVGPERKVSEEIEKSDQKIFEVSSKTSEEKHPSVSLTVLQESLNLSFDKDPLSIEKLGLISFFTKSAEVDTCLSDGFDQNLAASERTLELEKEQNDELVFSDEKSAKIETNQQVLLDSSLAGFESSQTQDVEPNISEKKDKKESDFDREVSELNRLLSTFPSSEFIRKNPQPTSLSKKTEKKTAILPSKISKQATKQVKILKRGPYKISSKSDKQEAVNLSLVTSIKEASKKFGIYPKNIKRWLKKGVDRKKGAGRKPQDPSMEQALLDWISLEIKNTQMFPKNKTIRSKAAEFSMKLGFKASKGWCDKFLRRNQDQLEKMKTDCQQDQTGYINSL